MAPVTRILCISAHADDGELWCGASMSRWAADGAEIDHACLSAVGNDDRLAEFYAACEILDVSPRPHGIPDMEFPKHREEIFELFCANADDAPDLVIIPPSGDRHQDHAVVHEEAKRAFRFCSLLGFDIPYNEPTNRPTWYQPVTYLAVMTKVKAIQCYESQSDKTYTKIDRIKSLATVRGCEIRHDYAEAFEMIRWVNQ